MLIAKKDRESEALELEEAACVDIFGTVLSSSPSPPLSQSSDVCLEGVSKDLLTEEIELQTINDNRQEPNSDDEVEAERPKNLTNEEIFEKLLSLLSTTKVFTQQFVKNIETTDEAVLRLREEKLKGRKYVKKPNGVSDEAAEKIDKKESRKRKRQSGVPDQEEAKRYLNGEPVPDDQPLLLSGAVLRDYQVDGFQWMAKLYENGINGILGDEMGLGKTIQVIALFCHLIEMGVTGPFLIVAPLSTISNWVSEFRRFAPDMPVVLYHGTKKERADLRSNLDVVTNLNCLDPPCVTRSVFVTSYEVAMNDRAQLGTVTWSYLVVDEGHRLKNRECKLIKELAQLRTGNKLLLTGTPLQNSLEELWSMLNFLMKEIFNDVRVFKIWFNPKDIDEGMENEKARILRQEREGKVLNILHQILTPFLKRRVKADVDLKIPPKRELLVYCPMSEKQHGFYEGIVNKTISDMLVKDVVNDENCSSNINCTDQGRPRRSIDRIDYKDLLKLESSDSLRTIEEYVKLVSKMNDDRDKKFAMSTAYTKSLDNARMTTAVNCSLKYRMMDLRKCTNHPYLIEFPLTEDGVYYKIDDDIVESCGKMKVFQQLLTALLDRKHKVLVFSQMTRMLDILECYMEKQNINYCRLDGSMGYLDRQKNIDQFNTDESYGVFLLSTRAGGLGINLTAADTVIIYDSDWNPQQDLQAQDRCHRYGQTKPVMIYRLVTANTIDEKIVERAAAKRKLEKIIIHSKKFKKQDSDGVKKTMEAISPIELLELLSSNDHAGVVNRKDGPVLTKEELAILLDRSDLCIGEKKLEGRPSKKKKSEIVPQESSLFRVLTA